MAKSKQPAEASASPEGVLEFSVKIEADENGKAVAHIDTITCEALPSGSAASASI